MVKATRAGGAIAAVCLLAATACSSDGDDTTSESAPTAAPTTAVDVGTDETAEASTTAAPATTAPPVEEWSIEAVGPGTFKTRLMEPGFTLSYGEGWVPLRPESRNQLNIEIPESSELNCAPCALLGVSAPLAETPEDVITSAIANGLELSEAEEVEVDGITGQRYEVIGGEGVLFESESSEFFRVNSADGPARFTLLETGGRVIVIHELAMPEVVDTVWPLSEEVIASIEWSTE